LQELTALSTTPLPAAPPNEPTITLDEYDQILTGMTLDQLVAIIGSQPATAQDFSFGGQTTTSFSWNGSAFGTSASFGFENGALRSKFQFGLR